MNNGRTCPVCHQWIGENMPHVCNWNFPATPPHPTYAPAPLPGGFTWVPPRPPPLSADDVRKIVREEIERRFPPEPPAQTVGAVD